MNFILHLLIDAAVLLGMTYILPTVTVKNYVTAILVALVIGILNATVGLLIRFPMNVVTLGLLSFFIHLFVTAIMIKIADFLFKDFKVRGFLPAIIIAVVLAIVGVII
jgi:putative membrane protein